MNKTSNSLDHLTCLQLRKTLPLTYLVSGSVKQTKKCNIFKKTVETRMLRKFGDLVLLAQTIADLQQRLHQPVSAC